MRVICGGLLTVVAVSMLGAPRAVNAQGGTDVYVAEITGTGSAMRIGRPRNATKRAGYDNQPAFTTDGETILFTSIREDAQADIWRVAFAGGDPSRLTSTTESEYSATPTPDGRGFSVIRVEMDSTQRLWRFGWNGSAEGVILPNLKPVGYHIWVSEATLGAFVLGRPNALVVADVRTEKVDTIGRNIGRAFARVPGRVAFTYAQLAGDSVWISDVEARTNTVTRGMQAPPRGEYHVWTPSGHALATAGTRIYLWIDGRWDVLADFAELGVRNITRIAISPRGDRVAFVAEDGALP